MRQLLSFELNVNTPDEPERHRACFYSDDYDRHMMGTMESDDLDYLIKRIKAVQHNDHLVLIKNGEIKFTGKWGPAKVRKLYRK